MAGPDHFVHPVMRLTAEAVRTRVGSGASPRHRVEAGGLQEGAGTGPAVPTCPTCG
jgi:hypothetical protein